MKRPIALLFCLLMITMPMAGCLGGDDSSDAQDEELDDWNVHFAATAADLPNCDEDTNGRLYYVEADNQFQVCKTSGWSVIDIQGSDGAAGNDGQDGAVGPQGPTGPTGPVYNDNGYIRNQYSSAQTPADFWISGSGKIEESLTIGNGMTLDSNNNNNGHRLSNGVLFAHHPILDAPGGSSHLGYRRRVPLWHSPMRGLRTIIITILFICSIFLVQAW